MELWVAGAKSEIYRGLSHEALITCRRNLNMQQDPSCSEARILSLEPSKHLKQGNGLTIFRRFHLCHFWFYPDVLCQQHSRRSLPSKSFHLSQEIWGQWQLKLSSFHILKCPLSLTVNPRRQRQDLAYQYFLSTKHHASHTAAFPQARLEPRSAWLQNILLTNAGSQALNCILRLWISFPPPF